MRFTSGPIVTAAKRLIPFGAVKGTSGELFRRQRFLFSTMKMKVPTMGDSITEARLYHSFCCSAPRDNTEKAHMCVFVFMCVFTLFFGLKPQGTIVEWAVQVGQKVNEGDVVCLIETDKVTVDIKAEVGGVIVSLFGSV